VCEGTKEAVVEALREGVEGCIVWSMAVHCKVNPVAQYFVHGVLSINQPRLRYLPYNYSKHVIYHYHSPKSGYL